MRYRLYLVVVLSIATVIEWQTTPGLVIGKVALVNVLVGMLSLAINVVAWFLSSLVRTAERGLLLYVIASVCLLCACKWYLSAAFGCTLHAPVLDSTRLALLLQAPLVAVAFYSTYLAVFSRRDP